MEGHSDEGLSTAEGLFLSFRCTDLPPVLDGGCDGNPRQRLSGELGLYCYGISRPEDTKRALHPDTVMTGEGQEVESRLYIPEGLFLLKPPSGGWLAEDRGSDMLNLRECRRLILKTASKALRERP